MTDKITIHWFRRDLRLKDNTALNAALNGPHPVLPIFIFDRHITDELQADDARITFIHQQVTTINVQLNSQYHNGLKVLQGQPLEEWQKLIHSYNIAEVHFNRDYEPYALERDEAVTKLLESHGIRVVTHKDQVVFEAHEVLKKDGSPYTIYTPYKKQWISRFNDLPSINRPQADAPANYFQIQIHTPHIEELGFKHSPIAVPAWNFNHVEQYEHKRDIPHLNHTSHLGPHLRFGTISIREVIAKTCYSEVFLSELIWREFFMQIMVHFPQVIAHNFKRKYDAIIWQNNSKQFERWCQGQTGYPIVDAGMRELVQTGFMHNRVRMVCASFLCKHLLIDWRWGEAFFAQHLLDFELASNNGNWQWAAGTGCDAAPYFRVFNPSEQQKKFDPELKYILKWVPEFGTMAYPQPMVEHKAARLRAIEHYKMALQ
ncbi:cryptochrome/photolyase family protein [Carboxylicivirga taeanensis]|uniref:cryptochrome/photolyase family protein n=1 Tax=Carboxylicivirga taeanensis TaxID=1416875 RepID=UPI003F6DBFD1